MGELVISPATEHDRATFLASVDGLFHEDAGVRDVYADQEWVARGGAAYFADLLTNPEAIPLLARDRERTLGHLVGRVLEPDTLRPGTRVAALESMRVVPEARGRGVGGRLVAAFFDGAKEHGGTRQRHGVHRQRGCAALLRPARLRAGQCHPLRDAVAQVFTDQRVPATVTRVRRLTGTGNQHR